MAISFTHLHYRLAASPLSHCKPSEIHLELQNLETERINRLREQRNLQARLKLIDIRLKEIDMQEQHLLETFHMYAGSGEILVSEE